MELQKLPKEHFPINGGREEPTITFYSTGKIVLNRAAVSHLHLHIEQYLKGVSFFEDKKIHSDICISGDVSGDWNVKHYSGGRAVFNNRSLARHIIQVTFDKHPRRGEDTIPPPSSYSFRIAKLPIDDGDHKNIFALIPKIA